MGTNTNAEFSKKAMRDESEVRSPISSQPIVAMNTAPISRPCHTVPKSAFASRRQNSRTRKANAISKITLSQAIKFEKDGETVKDFRLSATSTGAKTNRSREVENILIGKKITAETTEEVIKAFDEVISPRAMPEFRREATRRMIRRFLTEAAKHPANKVIDTYDGYYMPGAPTPRE